MPDHILYSRYVESGVVVDHVSPPVAGVSSVSHDLKKPGS
jgi:hypothetical protein